VVVELVTVALLLVSEKSLSEFRTLLIFLMEIFVRRIKLSLQPCVRRLEFVLVLCQSLRSFLELLDRPKLVGLLALESLNIALKVLSFSGELAIAVLVFGVFPH